MSNSPLQPNIQYRLQVAIGVGKYSYRNLGYIQLVNGTNANGTVLAQANVSSLNMANFAGTFQDLVLDFTTGATVSRDLTVVVGTVKNIIDMNGEYLYHDQHGLYNNGNGQYGSNTVAPDKDDAIVMWWGHNPKPQPLDMVDTTTPSRQFLADSMRTYLLPLDGATSFVPSDYKVGCGSFMAKWGLPSGGSVLKQEIIWETRVRYVTPPYFWFAL